MDYTKFPINKYANWYINLIETRKTNDKEKLKTEAHHIFPVSIFGKNDNTVNLTHREHFVAHLLLWKMYDSWFGDNHVLTKKMNKAITSFCTLSGRYDENIDIKINSKKFSEIREQFRTNMSQQAKAMWEDQQKREVLTKCRQEYWGKEENRQEQSARRKRYFSNPDNVISQTDINREITSRPEWKEQRSNKQKELSADLEYTNKRIKAMTTPDAIAKSKKSNRERISMMTKEEKQKMFGAMKNRMWITNGVDSKTIINGEDIPNGWRKGRTIKTSLNNMTNT